MKELQDIARLSDRFISVELVDESLFDWNVKLHQVDKDSVLWQDMKETNTEYILLNLTFPDNFPFSPPFMRVLSPRLENGYVLDGGAICMELLTPRGWSSAYTVEAVMRQFAASLVKGQVGLPAREGARTSIARDAGVCGCSGGNPKGGQPAADLGQVRVTILPEDRVSPVGRRQGHTCDSGMPSRASAAEVRGSSEERAAHASFVSSHPAFVPLLGSAACGTPGYHALQGHLLRLKAKGALRAPGGFVFGASRLLPFPSSSAILAGLLRAVLPLVELELLPQVFVCAVPHSIPRERRGDLGLRLGTPG
ncbi:hypothetical protein WISP_52321 [Willisornis vidua]|uniref:UBC core domain-containing protein n=1 Tax=Willisornis vidua TaxID=1566151 RepID=A0ABQ9DDG1_9PASS|nr:hypothetical protein WISP_52321 [Willisornis vidua]